MNNFIFKNVKLLVQRSCNQYVYGYNLSKDNMTNNVTMLKGVTL